MLTKYEKLSKQIASLQRELMNIDGYADEVYELMEQLIDELDYLVCELKEGNKNE